MHKFKVKKKNRILKYEKSEQKKNILPTISSQDISKKPTASFEGVLERNTWEKSFSKSCAFLQNTTLAVRIHTFPSRG